MTEAPAQIGIHEPIILTIDNGGTKTRVARGNESIGMIEAYDTPQDYEDAIAMIGETAIMVLDGKRPDAIGFSIAGKVEDGRIVQAGQLQNYGWTGLPFAEDIAQELGVAPERIVLLNDCAAGAYAERTARQLNIDQAGGFMVVSTGFGGAIYTHDRLISDEPGHEYLKPGAVCGDGEVGHIEAHIGGAGIAKKFGERGENIPHADDRWKEIKSDFHTSMALTLDRYKREHGISLDVIGFTGSVALGGPNMLSDLQQALNRIEVIRTPVIEQAVYRDDSGLYGASFAAEAALRAA